MNIRLAIVFSFVAFTCAFADDQVARVQQQLKDQGFYYGEITGEKNSDTAAAIRRFQIRSGLQITGELNDETLKALSSAASSASTPNKSVAAATAAPEQPRQTQRDVVEEQQRYPEEEEQAPPQRYAPPVIGQDRQVPPPVYPGRVAPAGGGTFARTPYETAPVEVQQEVIARAQNKLAKRDLYRGAVNGVFGPDLEFSLRAYQSRVGLQPTGRLDLETLAALELLPGADQPVFVPPHRAVREPPVRGEWVRP